MNQKASSLGCKISCDCLPDKINKAYELLYQPQAQPLVLPSQLPWQVHAKTTCSGL